MSPNLDTINVIETDRCVVTRLKSFDALDTVGAEALFVEWVLAAGCDFTEIDDVVDNGFYDNLHGKRFFLAHST